ncbi:MAG: hypothetical protein AAGE52_24105 [Myxococcota bacterium]
MSARCLVAFSLMLSAACATQGVPERFEREAAREAEFEAQRADFQFEARPPYPAGPRWEGEWVEGRTLRVHSVEPCTSGPIDVVIPVQAAPRRELVLEAYSPRRLSFVAEVWDGETRRERAEMGASWQAQTLDEAHARCRVLAADGEPVQVRAPREGVRVPLRSASPATTVRPAPEVPNQEPAEQREFRLTERPPTDASERELTIRLWSARSLDLRDVVFAVRERHFVVEGGLRRWVAEWQRAEAEREAYPDVLADWRRRRNAAWAAWLDAHPDYPRTTPPAPRNVEVGRTAGARRERAERTPELIRFQQERRARALAECESDECRARVWDNYCGRHPREAPCPERLRQERAEEARRRAARYVRPASEPPPPPRAETQPPRPDANATWIPGSWRWSGQAYEWSPGVWRQVPAEEEVAVAAAPPPKPAEVVPAAPSADSIWVPGYWQPAASSAGYEWVAGRWRTPPTQGARWAAPRIEIRVGRRFFVRGRWLR